MRKFRIKGIFADITGRGQKDYYEFSTLRGTNNIIGVRKGKKIKNKFGIWKRG